MRTAGADAAKDTPPGGNIRLQAQRQGGELVIEVIDDGLGIPAAALAKAFEVVA